MDHILLKNHVELFSRMDLWVILLVLCLGYVNACQTEPEGGEHCFNTSVKAVKEGSSVEVTLPTSKEILDLCIWRSAISTWESACHFYGGICRTLLRDFKEQISVGENILTLQNVSQKASGIYKVLDYSGSCVAWINVSVEEVPRHCPLDNVLVTEGSSEIIIAITANNSHQLALWKKNHSSSDWQHIMSITNGDLNYSIRAYEGHFSILDGGFAIKDVRKWLTGEYQLAYGYNEGCIQHFFLNVLGSEDRQHHVIWAAGIPVLLLFAYILFCVWRQKRKRDG